MKVGHVIVKILEKHGVKNFFGVPGHHNLPLYEAIHDYSLQHVLFHEETNAGFAADGYSKITGLGVVDATAGPGALRLVPAIAESYSSSTALVAIVGDVDLKYVYSHKYGRSNVAQQTDQLAIFKPITKAQYLVTSPYNVEDVVRNAIKVAISGRPGPVLIDIPVDIFWGSYEDLVIKDQKSEIPVTRFIPTDEDLRRAANEIKNSRKPVLLCGGGVHIARAWDEVRILRDVYRIPVVTTISGKGSVEETHPLSLGVIGDLGGWEPAAEAINESDLVIVVGSKLPQYATYNWKLLEGKKIIHIDIDPEEIGRNFPVVVGLVGDAKETLKKLNDMLAGWQVSEEWVKLVSKLKSQYLEMISKDYILNDIRRGVNPKRVIAVLNKITDSEDILVSDASSSSGWTAKYYIVKRSGRVYIAPRGFAGLGYSLPAGIGVYASGAIKGRVIVVSGDGGFGYYVSELETLKRTGYPIMVIVLNDSALGWIKLEQEYLQGGKILSSTFLLTDYARIAESYGIRGYRIERESELEATLREAYMVKEPVVVDIATITDPSFSHSLYAISKKYS
ncbi:MAG: thiamine pyrophosphate-binding protein [Sulfolobales archaeon]